MPDSRTPLVADSVLVKQAKSGDIEAFGALYERYARDIYRFLRAQLSDDLEAEDLTSEVFLRAWLSVGRYRERGFAFSAFLFKIARNALIDHWRKVNKTDRHQEIETVEGALVDPGDRVERNQDLQDLRVVLAELREDYRSVLVLRFINGLSPKEIAPILGRSEGAVRVLQHRALSVARQKIRKRVFDEDEP